MRRSIFVVRAYLMINEFGAIRVDAECAFATSTEASRFLNSLCENAPSKSDYERCRNEIVELELGNADGFFHREIYSVKGELLERDTYDVSGRTFAYMRTQKGATCYAGDLVTLYQNIENGESSFPWEQNAIVIDISSVDNEPDLTVGYIDSAGYFAHKHGANNLIKSVLDQVSFGEHVEVLLKAFSAWNHPSRASNTMRRFLDGDIPHYKLET